MGELIILDSTGDSKIIWNPKNETEVDGAEMQFNHLIDEGYTAYSVKKDGKKNKKITEFDPDAGKLILVPPVAGG